MVGRVYSIACYVKATLQSYQLLPMLCKVLFFVFPRRSKLNRHCLRDGLKGSHNCCMEVLLQFIICHRKMCRRACTSSCYKKLHDGTYIYVVLRYIRGLQSSCTSVHYPQSCSSTNAACFLLLATTKCTLCPADVHGPQSRAG